MRLKRYLFLLVPAIGLLAFTQQTPENFIEEAKLFEMSGDFKSAVNSYKKALKINQKHYEANLGIGNAFHILNNYDSAMTFYNKAIALEPANGKAHFFKGNLNVDLGNNLLGIADYSKAIELNPNDMEYHMHRGFTYANTGDYYKAIFDYSIGIQLDSDGAKAYFNMAKTQGLLDSEQLVCEQVNVYREKGLVQAEVVYLNFCLASTQQADSTINKTDSIPTNNN